MLAAAPLHSQLQQLLTTDTTKRIGVMLWCCKAQRAVRWSLLTNIHFCCCCCCRYSSEIEAAQAFDRAAICIYGERAITNFGVAAACQQPTPVSASILMLKQEYARVCKQQEEEQAPGVNTATASAAAADTLQALQQHLVQLQPPEQQHQAQQQQLELQQQLQLLAQQQPQPQQLLQTQHAAKLQTQHAAKLQTQHVALGSPHGCAGSCQARQAASAVQDQPRSYSGSSQPLPDLSPLPEGSGAAPSLAADLPLHPRMGMATKVNASLPLSSSTGGSPFTWLQRQLGSLGISRGPERGTPPADAAVAPASRLLAEMFGGTIPKQQVLSEDFAACAQQLPLGASLAEDVPSSNFFAPASQQSQLQAQPQQVQLGASLADDVPSSNLFAPGWAAASAQQLQLQAQPQQLRAQQVQLGASLAEDVPSSNFFASASQQSQLQAQPQQVQLGASLTDDVTSSNFFAPASAAVVKQLHTQQQQLLQARAQQQQLMPTSAESCDSLLLWARQGGLVSPHTPFAQLMLQEQPQQLQAQQQQQLLQAQPKPQQLQAQQQQQLHAHAQQGLLQVQAQPQQLLQVQQLQLRGKQQQAHEQQQQLLQAQPQQLQVPQQQQLHAHAQQRLLLVQAQHMRAQQYQAPAQQQQLQTQQPRLQAHAQQPQQLQAQQPQQLQAQQPQQLQAHAQQPQQQQLQTQQPQQLQAQQPQQLQTQQPQQLQAQQPQQLQAQQPQQLQAQQRQQLQAHAHQQQQLQASAGSAASLSLWAQQGGLVSPHTPLGNLMLQAQPQLLHAQAPTAAAAANSKMPSNQQAALVAAVGSVGGGYVASVSQGLDINSMLQSMQEGGHLDAILKEIEGGCGNLKLQTQAPAAVAAANSNGVNDQLVALVGAPGAIGGGYVACTAASHVSQGLGLSSMLQSMQEEDDILREREEQLTLQLQQLRQQQRALGMLQYHQ